MSNLNENSLSSYERSHPNRGLTLENLSVKSLNKNLNKSINSMNNSMHRSNKISKKSSDISSKNNQKPKNSNVNSKKTNSKNAQNKFHSKSKSSLSSKNQNNNININNSNNYSPQVLMSQTTSNKYEEESELYNYFYYNDVCSDNDLYLAALNETLSVLDNIFNDLDLNGRINKLLELANDESKNIRLGSLVCLYLLIKNNYNSLDEKNKSNILTEIITLLQSYEKQDEIFLLSCLEICTLFGLMKYFWRISELFACF